MAQKQKTTAKIGSNALPPANLPPNSPFSGESQHYRNAPQSSILKRDLGRGQPVGGHTHNLPSAKADVAQCLAVANHKVLH
jgi:hypothetical protein